MKQLTVFCLLLWSTCLWAQNTEKITILGQVTDENNQPVENVALVDTLSQQGTTTNEAGNFSLQLSKQDIHLRISYIGFHTQIKVITPETLAELPNDTLTLFITLQPKVEQLEKFEISSQRKPELAYGKANISVLDFQFYEDHLLVLIKKKKYYYLRLVDENRQIIAEQNIPKKPTSLFKDCMGNIHVVYRFKEEVHQVAILEDAKIYLMDAITEQQFDEYLSSCVAAYPDKFFFKKYALHNQAVSYYLIKKDNPQKKYLQQIVNERTAIATQDYYNEMQIKAGMAPTASAAKTRAQLDLAREVDVMSHYYKSVMLKPTYQPLFKVRDSIFIFNHQTDTAFVYNDLGNLQRTFPIHHHQQKSWKKQLIKDETQATIYAKTQQRGYVYLSPINVDNGQVSQAIKLSKHLFPEKLKIRNGIAYYLGDNFLEADTKKIYKQKL